MIGIVEGWARSATHLNALNEADGSSSGESLGRAWSSRDEDLSWDQTQSLSCFVDPRKLTPGKMCCTIPRSEQELFSLLSSPSSARIREIYLWLPLTISFFFLWVFGLWEKRKIKKLGHFFYLFGRAEMLTLQLHRALLVSLWDWQTWNK